MKKLLTLLAVVLVFLSSSSLASPACVPQFGRFVILIHDVSPAYLSQLREIAALIDRYGLQNETYLFVIPNHGGKMPMWKYKAFMAFLKRLKGRGYHIELHGYDHIGDEFDCNASTAEKKLELGLKALAILNVTPRYFIAPRYTLSREALEVLLAHNITVIGEDFLYFPNGTAVPVLNREYTWYLPSFLLSYQLASAEESYRNCNCTFFLSIHPKATNNRAGTEFLSMFLNFVRGKDKG